MAVVLLVATGLMVRSFRNLVNERWGFAIDNRLVFDVTFSTRLRPEHEARVAFVEQALERLRALPEVAEATATTPDLVALGRSLAAVTPEGTTPRSGGGSSSSTIAWSSPATSRTRASRSSRAGRSSGRMLPAASGWRW